MVIGMNKEFLLAKSNFRKNRGTSIGVFLLMMLAALLLSLSLMIALDVKPTADKESRRLKSGNAIMCVQTIDEGIDETYIREKILGDKVEWSQFNEALIFDVSQSVPFADGCMMLTLAITDERVFDNKYDVLEVVKEDKSITGPYIYLPYQLYTSGGFHVGDEYKINLIGKERSYKIRGFVNTSYYGCNNSGRYRFILDSESYKALYEESKDVYAGLIVNFDLKDGVKVSQFGIQAKNRFIADGAKGSMAIADIESVNSDKTFMSNILFISFIMVSVIIFIVTSLMLSNCIRNYIRENMTNIGALKAMGYTSSNIKTSLLVMFLTLAVVGAIIGAALSYLLVPVMAGIFEGQAGVPYKMSFNPIAFVAALGFVVAFTMLVTLLATHRLKKVEVVSALRGGLETHNFKKNAVALDKSSLSLNLSLSMKTLFTNLKQNITTFFVTGLLVFVCVIALLMYENFSRNPILEILTPEFCSGVVAVNRDDAEEAKKYIEELGGKNVRYMIDASIGYKDEEKLQTYMPRDMEKFQNKNYCYKGRFPKYDNEVCVSGKFAKEYGYKIGDEIKLNYGDSEYAYLITGFIQSCNNSGREALMSEVAAGHIVDMNTMPTGIWFDADGEKDTNRILEACKEKFGDKIVTTLNFYELMDGFMKTFKSITVLMLVSMLIISAVVIMLVLYLFIKTLLYNKRKDYGIYKALGFTSKDLMLQTAGSFMPTIILSVIVFSIVSYFTANTYMSFIMVSFGMMKCSFVIPVGGVVIIGIGMIILAFVFAMLQTRKIKKIEAYDMLIEA